MTRECLREAEIATSAVNMALHALNEQHAEPWRLAIIIAKMASMMPQDRAARSLVALHLRKLAVGA